MSVPHAPEPWLADGCIIVSSARDSSSMCVAIATTRANAARIVACVNACAGLAPEVMPDLLAAARAVRHAGPSAAELDDAESDGRSDLTLSWRSLDVALARATHRDD